MKQSLGNVLLLAILILGSQYSVGFAVLLDNNCGVSTSSYRITGGRDAGLMSAPWMAYLHTNPRFICGGSLVNPRFVLTAAHCFAGNATTIYVRLGENDSSQRMDCENNICAPSPADYWIMQKFLHPKFQTSRYYDIALVKLNQHVIYSDSVRPICVNLNPMWQSYVDGISYLTVHGWGATRFADVSAKLQTTQIPQVDRLTCRSYYGYNVDRTHICAGESKHYVGKGDSGGPLGSMVNTRYNTMRYFQFGIVSHLRQPFMGVSVFTNILPYSNWIYQTILTNYSY
ncbi:serine protease grass [Drosophila eugracilis]|uniref:serine protease grass n=1 Tax=Drosophila eugracilis TaxID=29029 RepID=UPI0007E6F72C|nr:serine protease grass [Drosophila eugracilis]